MYIYMYVYVYVTYIYVCMYTIQPTIPPHHSRNPQGSALCRAWVSHSTRKKELWHTYEWVMAHVCMSHVTHVNETCLKPYHTYEWVMSHIWWIVPHARMSHALCHTVATHRTAPFDGPELVLAHMWMSHGTHMHESWHTYDCLRVMSHSHNLPHGALRRA